MKLEYKHLAPYFQYKLKGLIHDYEVATLVVLSANNSIGILKENETCWKHSSLYMWKPILRPLSDLTQKVDGKIPLVELAKILDKNFQTVEVFTNEKPCNYYFNGFCNITYFCESVKSCLSVGLSDGGELINIYRNEFIPANIISGLEYLYSQHFDLRGLIDMGLAVNQNDIYNRDKTE